MPLKTQNRTGQWRLNLIPVCSAVGVFLCVLLALATSANIDIPILALEALDEAGLSTTGQLGSLNGFLSHPTHLLDGSAEQAKEAVALCCVLKDEGLYLDEWADYHLALGFHLYIYDNSDEHQNVLSWVARRGESDKARIELVHFPGNSVQIPAYKACARHVRKNNLKWVFFGDVDEFFVITSKSLANTTIVDFARMFAKTGHLAINWRVFGTAGQLHYQDLPVTRRFQCRVPDNAVKNAYIKCLIRIDDLVIDEICDPHIFPLRKGARRRFTNGRMVNRSAEMGPNDVAAIYHYYYKSRDEQVNKYKRGDVFFGPQAAKGFLAKANKGLDVNGRALPQGPHHDSTGWEALKRWVPKYAEFDNLTMLEPINCSRNRRYHHTEKWVTKHKTALSLRNGFSFAELLRLSYSVVGSLWSP